MNDDARRGRGFTLVELSMVLAVMAVLAAITVPLSKQVLERARASEARTMVSAIADAELRYFRDHGTFLACEDPDEKVPVRPRRLPERACWESLGFGPEGVLRYRYQATLDGNSFAVLAEGDLDADGVTSRYRLAGATMALTVEKELE